MGKTNAQRQKKYRERKKLSDPNFLKRESMRQKRYYKPTKTLTKSQLKKRREAVKRRVEDSRSRAKQAREIRETSRADVIKTDFSKRGESSRKRRRLSEEKIQLKMKQFEHENTILKRKAERLYKRLQREAKRSLSRLIPRKKVDVQLRKQGISLSKVKQIRKQLIYGEVLSEEIRLAFEERKNKRIEEHCQRENTEEI